MSLEAPISPPSIEAPVMLVGHVKLTLTDKDGKIKDFREVKNVLCERGWDIIAERLGNPGTAYAAANHISIGTGTTAASSTDRSLVGQVYSRSGQYTATSSGYQTYQVQCTFAAGEGTAEIQESGVFRNSGGITDQILCRQVFGKITKGAADSLQVTWIFRVQGA